MSLPTLGVEEELLLLDPRTSTVLPVAPQALAAHQARWPDGSAGAPRVEAELYQQQLETATEPCADAGGAPALAGPRPPRRPRRRAMRGAVAVAVPTPALAGGDERLTPTTATTGSGRSSAS